MILRRLLLPLACVLLLWSGFSPAWPQQRPARAPQDDAAVAAVSAALRGRQFPEAVAQSESALRRMPGDPRLWTLQGVAYDGLHQPAEALRAFRRALQIAPAYLPALEGAAQVSYANHDPQTEAVLRRLLAVQPADPLAHAMLGELRFGAKDCEGAATQFAAAQPAIGERPEVLLHWSSCLVELGRYAEAIPVFEQMQRLAPGSATVRYDLALAQFRAGQLDAADATLAPALAAAEPREEELTLGAQIAEGQGKTQGALDLLRKAIGLYPREQDAYLDFVHLAYQHASMQVGLDMVNLGLQQMPNAAELYFARGVLLCQTGHVDEGFADFAKADALDPGLQFVGVAQGIARSQAHDPAAALARFRAEVRAHPGDGLAWYLLAEALFEGGAAADAARLHETLEAAQRAVRLDPKRVEARDLLASVQLQAGDVPGAIATSRAALAADPSDPQALYHLLLAVRKTGDKAEVPELVKRLVAARQSAEEKAQRERPRVLVEGGVATP